MTNCLVKKYKGDTQNNSLPVFGDIVLEAKAITLDSGKESSESELRIGYPKDAEYTVSIEGDGYFAESYDDLSDQSKTKTSETYIGTITPLPYPYPNNNATYTGSYKKLYFSNGNYKIHINSKYRILFLNPISGGPAPHTIINFNLDDYEYCTDLLGVDWGYSYNVVGNLKSLAKLTKCGFMNLAKCYNITGCLDDIGHLTKLNKLFLYGINLTKKSNIEDFVQAQVNNGSSQRTVSLPLGCRSIGMYTKFGGNDITGFTTNEYASGWLTWDGTDRIVLYLDSTGANVDVNNCTTIYAKGATAEEITAWRAANKTVVEIS